MTARSTSRIVTMLTDFGDTDGYVAQMKGVILTITPSVQIVDITHRIPAQSVTEGAAVLRDAASQFPEGTVHLAVVDPGVGSTRRAVAAVTQQAVFVGPDNGVLWPAIDTMGGGEFYELKDPRYHRALVSPTFHGRDIFAPAAAHLAAGVPAAEIGPRIDDALQLALPAARQEGTGIVGEVLRVDHFGNLVTNVTGGQLLKLGMPEVQVRIAGQRVSGISETYSSVESGQLVCVVGSGGCLEIARRDGSASQCLEVSVGAKVEVAPRGG